MTPERLKELKAKYAPFVRTHCDNYHGHTWERGCFASDNPEALVICELIDYINKCSEKTERIIETLRSKS